MKQVGIVILSTAFITTVYVVSLWLDCTCASYSVELLDRCRFWFSYSMPPVDEILARSSRQDSWLTLFT